MTSFSDFPIFFAMSLTRIFAAAIESPWLRGYLYRVTWETSYGTAGCRVVSCLDAALLTDGTSSLISAGSPVVRLQVHSPTL
jgi:hypothetical protein